MNLLPLLNETANQTGSPSWAPMILMYAVVIGAVWFIMIRPQKKKEKEHRALIDSVGIGDNVLTTSGFYGIVIDVSEEVVVVEFGSNKNCRIPMKKEAIVEIEKAETPE